tara:strand:+ start:219 stop:437 length:219 start_codon:yes stop_codon:yes gene_type:complete
MSMDPLTIEPYAEDIIEDELQAETERLESKRDLRNWVSHRQPGDDFIDYYQGHPPGRSKTRKLGSTCLKSLT